jgi:peptidoglycan/LPS O-acetylase OafA/YrhL
MEPRIINLDAGQGASDQRSLPLLQILRGVAALAVVTCHLGYELSRHYAWDVVNPLFALGNAGVDVFFVISGFVIVYVSEPLFGRAYGPTYFLLRRLIRIIPLYWAATVVVLLDILLRYASLAAANLTFDSVLASFFFFPVERPTGQLTPLYSLGWTLNYEMFFYAMFSIAIWATRRVAIAAIAISFVALVVLGRFLQLPPAIGFWTNPLILEFVLGMMVAAALREGVRCSGALASGMIAIGLGAYAAAFYFDAGASLSRVLIWGLPASLIVAGLILSRPAGDQKAARAFCLLGDASYSLYLVHPFVFVFIRRVLPDLSHVVMAPLIYAVLLLSCSVVMALLVHRFVEKPTIRILRAGLAYFTRSSPKTIAEEQPIEASAESIEIPGFAMTEPEARPGLAFTNIADRVVERHADAVYVTYRFDVLASQSWHNLKWAEQKPDRRHSPLPK